MKYFRELHNNSHLDLYYGKKSNKNLIRSELKKIYNEFYDLCEKNNILFILMHGSLIGWYFGKKMLPWDDDIDICIFGNNIDKLIKLNRYETDNLILLINPNFINRSLSDKHNVIDARVISKKNGVFIDITFLYESKNKYILNCKSPHYYNINDLFPLKKTTFENIITYIPNNYKKCLLQEYGPKVLYPIYRNWIFYNGWKKMI